MSTTSSANPTVLAAATLWPAYTLWRRELVRFFREKGRVVGALGTPLIFWLFIGSGFDNVFRPAGADASAGYFSYFLPGIVVLVLLFTAIFSTFSVIEDRQAGFLQGVLVAPVSRQAIVIGKLLGGTTLAVGQGLLLVGIAWLAPNVDVSLTLGAFFGLVGILTLVAFGLVGLGFTLAWRMSSTQGFHSIMNLLLMPMWLLSGAVFPADSAPTWLGILMAVNPLTYGMTAVRAALGFERPGSEASFPIAIAVTIGFMAVTFWTSVRAVRKIGANVPA